MQVQKLIVYLNKQNNNDMKCALCREDVTHPYYFNGLVFGYTCIKIVNPTAKKLSPKTNLWVKADSFTSSILDNGYTKIVATYQGGNYKAGRFSDYHKLFTTLNGNLILSTPATIIIQDDSAYINLKAYNTGLQYLKQIL